MTTLAVVWTSGSHSAGWAVWQWTLGLGALVASVAVLWCAALIADRALDDYAMVDLVLWAAMIAALTAAVLGMVLFGTALWQCVRHAQTLGDALTVLGGAGWAVWYGFRRLNRWYESRGRHSASGLELFEILLAAPLTALGLAVGFIDLTIRMVWVAAAIAVAACAGAIWLGRYIDGPIR